MELSIPVSVKNKEDERPSLQTQHLTELVCPVCYEYMQPPIMLCERGHSICELCHELMSECPLCQGRLTCRRSSALEALTAVMMFPCKHCNKRYRLEELDSHNCFQSIENDHSPTATCIIGQVYGDCIWSGPAIDMTTHCSRNHSDNFWTTPEIKTTWKCSDLISGGVQNIFIVNLNNAMFVIVQKFVSHTCILSWNLSCESENGLYDYEIRVISIDGSEVLVKKIQIENAFNIMTFFPGGNEITVKIDKISEFLKDNILKYKIIIKNRDNADDEIICVNKIRTSQGSTQFEIDNTEKEKQGCARKAWSSVVNFYNAVKKLLHL